MLLRKENGGAASACNHAIAAATGDFVVVLDADDFYDPDRIGAIASASAARPDLDLVATDAWLVQDGVRIGTYSQENPFPATEQRAGILEACFPGGWPAVRRERLLEAGGFDESYRVAHDWECWLRLIMGGASCGMVDAPLLTYHIHAASLSANKPVSLRERVRMLRSVDPGRLSPLERELRARAIARDSRRLRKMRIRSAGSALRRAIRPSGRHS